MMNNLPAISPAVANQTPLQS